MENVVLTLSDKAQLEILRSKCNANDKLRIELYHVTSTFASVFSRDGGLIRTEEERVTALKTVWNDISSGVKFDHRILRIVHSIEKDLDGTTKQKGNDQPLGNYASVATTGELKSEQAVSSTTTNLQRAEEVIETKQTESQPRIGRTSLKSCLRNNTVRSKSSDAIRLLADDNGDDKHVPLDASILLASLRRTSITFGDVQTSRPRGFRLSHTLSSDALNQLPNHFCLDEMKAKEKYTRGHRDREMIETKLDPNSLATRSEYEIAITSPSHHAETKHVLTDIIAPVEASGQYEHSVIIKSLVDDPGCNSDSDTNSLSSSDTSNSGCRRLPRMMRTKPTTSPKQRSRSSDSDPAIHLLYEYDKLDSSIRSSTEATESVRLGCKLLNEEMARQQNVVCHKPVRSRSSNDMQVFTEEYTGMDNSCSKRSLNTADSYHERSGSIRRSRRQSRTSYRSSRSSSSDAIHVLATNSRDGSLRALKVSNRQYRSRSSHSAVTTKHTHSRSSDSMQLMREAEGSRYFGRGKAKEGHINDKPNYRSVSRRTRSKSLNAVSSLDAYSDEECGTKAKQIIRRCKSDKQRGSQTDNADELYRPCDRNRIGSKSRGATPAVQGDDDSADYVKLTITRSNRIYDTHRLENKSDAARLKCTLTMVIRSWRHFVGL